MTKSKSLASSFVVSSTFVILLMNGKQFLNATLVARLRPVIMVLPLTKM